MKVGTIAIFSLGMIGPFCLGPPLLSQQHAYELRVEGPTNIDSGSEFLATLEGITERALLGYTAVITYAPGFLSLVKTDFAGTVWSQADYLNAVDDPLQGKITAVAVMDKDGIGPSLVNAGVLLDFLHLTFQAGFSEGATTIGFLDRVDANMLADVELLGHDIANGLKLKPASLEITDRRGRFIRSDCNTDTKYDISDCIYMIYFLFLGGGPLLCSDACDANDDEKINIADPIFLLYFMFIGGDQPPSPFPLRGVDTTTSPAGNLLDCEVGLEE